MRNCLAIGLVTCGLFGSLQSTKAQESVLAELYGQGVHAYFSGQPQVAHEYLTTAVEQGIRDPRAYFFRGLAYTQLGRPDEAKMDFEKGAELETSGADRIYPVGRSLQRVQGRVRLDVEKYRQMARLAALKRDMKAKAVRYEQLKNAEGEVLRDPNRPAPPKSEELVGPPAANASDPFGGGATPAEPEATTAPPVAEVTDPATPGADPLDPGNDTPAMPPMDESDPFGGGDDPFGAPPADDATIDPFGDDPAADDAPAMDADDDPFAP
jgi:hypothetical protein